MTVKIENYNIEIYRNNTKNICIGEFLNDSTMPKVYGDSIYEVIDQIDKLIRERGTTK